MLKVLFANGIERLVIYNNMKQHIHEYKVIGVDGCKLGWICVIITQGNIEINLYEEFSELIFINNDTDLFIVDMPIGLPENSYQAELRPERIARKLLPKKASSVFNVPCRQAVYKDTYDEANEQNKQVLGKGLSKQSFYIADKCKEVDVFLREYSQFKNKIVESHPELQFARFTENKQPILSSKKSSTGLFERERILTHILKTFFDIDLNIINYPLYKKHPDDVVDALCLAVAAGLCVVKGAKTIPENPECESSGLLMKMTYYDI